MQIGYTLMRLRKMNNLSCSKVAEEIGSSTSYLSELENDKKKISLLILEKYSHVLEISVTDILCLHDHLAHKVNVVSDLAHEVRAHY